MFKSRRNLYFGTAGATALLAMAALLFGRTEAQNPRTDAASVAGPGAPAEAAHIVNLTEAQLQSVKVMPVAQFAFAVQREAVGYVDFNQDRTVQVFSPWAGRIKQVFVRTGEDVKQGAPLFSIDSPDLVQAESNLIATAGVLELTTRALERARKMIQTQANAQKDLDQAISDQQTAEANYKAARDAVRIFGKSEAEMDAILATRKPEGELHIASPLTGQVTSRSASPGSLVQPGTAPAPVAVADVSTVWIVANVTEYDLPLLQPGQEVTVSILAYPGRKFRARVSNIGAMVDPTTHRIAVRSDISDPHHELRPQMLATFLIRTGQPRQAVAVPVAGVVREGDGTMTVFVTRDGRRFERRAVQIGVTQDGLTQILAGLSAGELVASDGALFLSNALALQTR
jgi:cobalt-zinc-cadmium efflux system membrane fusion protein